ncbi:kinase-like protein [Lentinus tigrinus ALCF2SS1-7]|uniref:non-specific serine/threonine protein kinase n=1 Tax=Lentinus tigrinus ALCF2SS1-6 TaxID=1328759 RepID=A0A5C2RNY1_9APHY|nr:kinase-like protein [Lentinus tigrinus ALCF2SS1-6]RPD68725.1 kinase-like protein [Lentinus tigrinus ALCF2SS1-7]
MDPSQKLVAVKKCHVTDHVEHPRLQHEACALVLLQGHRAIPHVYAWGKSQFYEYLALELLDTVLSDLKGKLTLRNLAAIAHEVLEGLRFIHSHGIVHCDIKPANLMFGLVGAEPSRVRIIDFGICRPFRDPVTSVHRPDVGTPQSIGTEGYMSLNGHLHHSPWRRDDVESLSYVMLSLMASRLPWDARGKPRDRLSSRGSYALKKQWTGARLAGDLSVFGAFVDYARRLEYAQELDYGRWKEHFRALAQGTSDASDSDPLYDPLDTASGASVVVDADFELPEDVYRLALADPSGGDSDTVLPQSKTPPSLKGSLGRWRPAYTWEMAVPVEDDELLGDECEIVRTRLDAVDAVPEGQGYYLEPSCPPEVMRPALMKNPTAEWEKDSSKIGGAINSKESRPPLGELPL